MMDDLLFFNYKQYLLSRYHLVAFMMWVVSLLVGWFSSLCRFIRLILISYFSL